jgi:CO/xanthine dehydrogenase Mo-binding subunit
MAMADREELVVAMTLVPGLVSRNRSFALFEDSEVRRARARAALLRGIVRQLAGGSGRVEQLDVASGQAACEMRYRVPSVRMERRAVLSRLEYGCVAYLAGRAGVPGIQANEEDRARIEAALRRLAAGLKLADLEGF